MKNMKNFTFLILLIFGIQVAYSQHHGKAKRIKFKDRFHHKSSNTVFHKNLNNGYILKDAYKFDKKKSNIGVTYEKKTFPKGSVSIYLYPAREGHETRLKDEYLSSLQVMANLTEKGMDLTQYPVKHKGKKYDCNGFKATFKTQEYEHSALSVYECGTWFFKLHISTEETDSSKIEALEKEILNIFDPSKLVGQKLLNPKANIYFAKAAFRDSTMLGSSMGSAYKKVNWLMENVPERERASGFAGHYLELQIAGFKEILEFDKKHKKSKSKITEDYLNQVRLITESTYLDEFLMEQFSMVMIVPETHEFDFDGYQLWKQNNEITLDLRNLYYVISFHTHNFTK